MCGIFCSFSADKIRELAKLNSYRGQHSYSIAKYSYDFNQIMELERSLGEFNYDSPILNDDVSGYYICHIQAPTTEAKDLDSIHPAHELDSYLWHNGILKNSTIKHLQMTLHWHQVKWDTLLLLGYLERDYSLNDVDGSFSCIWYRDNAEKLYHFRNQISPMYYDREMNMSSTMFRGSIQTPYDQILEINLKKKEFKNISTFKTVNNPYYFDD